MDNLPSEVGLRSQKGFLLVFYCCNSRPKTKFSAPLIVFSAFSFAWHMPHVALYLCYLFFCFSWGGVPCMAYKDGSEERERRRQPMWRQWPQGRQCNAKQTSLTSESAAEAHHCTSLLLRSSYPLAFPLYPAEIYVLWHHIILLTWIPTAACLPSCCDCFNTFPFISNRCERTHVSFQLCCWIPVPLFLFS